MKKVTCRKCEAQFEVELGFVGEKHLNCPVCDHPIMIEQHGGHCWKYGNKVDLLGVYNPDEPCCGHMNVTEDYPGEYTYFCDGHGHFEDDQEYNPSP